jgi:tRNA(Arg) A34 adenosine deaminase TadA
VNDRDERFLRIAIRLAAEARESGDPPFGSLLVTLDGRVLAEERNTTITARDITAHPELKLARWAARELPTAIARTLTMYTSCEPCAMCATAIARSNLGRIVYALSGDQLHDLRPGFVSLSAADVVYDGPALFDEARVPVDGYYA